MGLMLELTGTAWEESRLLHSVIVFITSSRGTVPPPSASSAKSSCGSLNAAAMRFCGVMRRVTAEYADSADPYCASIFCEKKSKMRSANESDLVAARPAICTFPTPGSGQQ